MLPQSKMSGALGNLSGPHPFFANKHHNIQNRRTKGENTPQYRHTFTLPHVLYRVLGHLDLGFLLSWIGRVQIHDIFLCDLSSCHDQVGMGNLGWRVRLLAFSSSAWFLPANTVNIFYSRRERRPGKIFRCRQPEESQVTCVVKFEHCQTRKLAGAREGEFLICMQSSTL